MTQKNSKRELLPCPFCGSEVVMDVIMKTNYGIHCPNEQCLLLNGTTIIFRDKENLITSWNTRPVPWIPKECDCGGRTYECIECGEMYHSDTPEDTRDE